MDLSVAINCLFKGFYFNPK